MSQQTVKSLPADESKGDVKVSDLSRIAVIYESPETGRMSAVIYSIRKEDVPLALDAVEGLRII